MKGINLGFRVHRAKTGTVCHRMSSPIKFTELIWSGCHPDHPQLLFGANMPCGTGSFSNLDATQWAVAGSGDSWAILITYSFCHFMIKENCWWPTHTQLCRMFSCLKRGGGVKFSDGHVKHYNIPRISQLKRKMLRTPKCELGHLVHTDSFWAKHSDRQHSVFSEQKNEQPIPFKCHLQVKKLFCW